MALAALKLGPDIHVLVKHSQDQNAARGVLIDNQMIVMRVYAHGGRELGALPR